MANQPNPQQQQKQIPVRTQHTIGHIDPQTWINYLRDQGVPVEERSLMGIQIQVDLAGKACKITTAHKQNIVIPPPGLKITMPPKGR